MKTILSAALAGMLAALSAMDAGAHDKAADRQVELVIEQQSLADALNEWAKQTGLQLVSASSDLMNTTVPPKIRGSYTAQGALDELLKDTSLTYEWVSERAVAIREKSPIVPAALQPTSKPGVQPTYQVTKLSGAEAREGRLGTPGPVLAQNAATSSPERVSRNVERNAQELEEIVVTGTHIRGTQNRTLPTTVLDKQYIESTGLSTTTSLIESLPQNFALASQSGVIVPGNSGAAAQGSSINLRGLGEGTTLVLLNGRRMALGFTGSAVDVSALPLSAMERVEVLTDGASALYGSDAIGGVVNFVLRRDFDGAETRIRSGWAEGGMNEYRLSQALGNVWSTGNALVSLEYYDRDLLPASERDFVPEMSEIGSLLPRDRNLSAVFSGRQDVTQTLSFFADALYAKRESYNEAGRIGVHEQRWIENPQVTAVTGLDWRIGNDWLIEASGSYARNKMHSLGSNDFFVALGLGSSISDSRFEIRGAQLKADGPLFDLPAGSVRAAIGTEWRSEAFEYSNAFTSGVPGTAADLDQTVRSAFGEVYVPIVGETNALAGVRRLELSFAGRFDDYSSFGSSFDPRLGLMWEPVSGLRFRGTYGTSYKAPKLDDYNTSRNFAAAGLAPDPGIASGLSYQLQVAGVDADGFSAQESKSSSFGFEFLPKSVPGASVMVNYYRINYRDQITDPPSADVILANPSSFGTLIIRDPTVDQVNQFAAFGLLGQGLFVFNPDGTLGTSISPELVDVIVDGRRRNQSVVKTSGLDLSLAYDLQTVAGNLRFSLAATHILELEKQITHTDVPFETVDTFYNPPDWRARGSIGWQHEQWATSVFANYTDSYVDNRAATDVPVSSYTTVDLNVRYDIGDRFASGFLSGMVISASVQNLLDRDPPRAAIINLDGDMGFDPTNASPMGRLIALELVKSW